MLWPFGPAMFTKIHPKLPSSSSLVLETESKADNENVFPTFQRLAKSGGKALDMVHAQKVLHLRGFHISSLYYWLC